MLGAEALAQRSARDFHLPMVERAARERYDYGRDRGNKIVQVCALASIHKSFQLQLPQLQFAFEGRGQGVAHADLPPKHRRSDVFSRHAIELACRPMDWLGFWLALVRRNGIAGSVIGGVEGGLLGISAIMARRRQEASGTTSSKNQHGLTRACRDQGVQRGLPKYVVPRPWDPPPDPPVCDLGAQFLFSCRTPATNADHGTHARHGQRAEVTPADLQLPKHSVFDAACTVARAVRAHLCKNPLAGTLARARAFRGGDGCRHRHTCKAALTRTAGCRSS